MSYSPNAFADEISATFTDERYSLGAIRFQGADDNKNANATHIGPKYWVFVFNDDVSAFAQGTLVSIDTNDYAPYHGLISAAAATVAGAMLGVAGHAIPAGSYGWIVKQGVTECMGDGDVVQGEAIVSHASGRVDTMATDEEEAVIGVALENDGSAGELFTCKVFIP